MRHETARPNTPPIPADIVATDAQRLRRMSLADFAAYGAEDTAYVKPVVIEGETLFVVYGADGRELALMGRMDVACAATRQNGMEPHSVH